MIAAPERCIVCGERPVAGVALDAARGYVRSPSCGLEWLDPFPGLDEMRERYGPAYLARWGAGDPRSFEETRRMKEATLSRFLRRTARHRATGRLLDLGCGPGFIFAPARRAGYEVYGIDLNEAAAEIARREAPGRVHAGPLDGSAFAGIRFDVVTLVDVLEHVDDPAALLLAIHARLAPGGIVAALVPNAASWTRRLLGSRWPHYVPEHLFCWTPASLSSFLTRRGWRVLDLRTGFRKTFTASYLLAYSSALGNPLPRALGLLGRTRFPAWTGEMIVVATPPASDGLR